jgi:hypothetical protein
MKVAKMIGWSKEAKIIGTGSPDSEQKQAHGNTEAH